MDFCIPLKSNIMSKQLLIIACLLYLWSNAEQLQAQANIPAKLEWGEMNGEPNNSVATKVIGITPEGFYVLRQKIAHNANAKPKVWVEYFTKEMKLQRAEELDLKYKRKRRDFEDVLYFGGKLYLLTSFNNTAKKRNYLFKQEVSLRSLVPSKTLDMICETEARNIESEGSFGFAISKDSSKLLVYKDLPYERKNPERFGFRVFDTDFNLVWEKNIVLPYPDNKFTVEEYRVDEVGNVFLLGVLYEDDAKWRRRGNPTYKYVLLSYLQNGEKNEEIRVDLEGKFVTDLTFRVAKDGNLVFAGFYSEKGTYSIKGTYFFQLNPHSREIMNRNAVPFEFDFLTAFMSEKNKERAMEAVENNDKRRSPELYDYSLDELILRSDGGAVLVAEQFYIEQQTYRDNPYGFYPYGYYNPYYYGSPYNQQVDYFFHYNDIIVVNIKPTGEVEWASRIPKVQETRNDNGYYSSYAMMTTRDGFYFVYNDDARNFGERKSNRYYAYTGSSRGVPVIAKVSITGQVDLQPLIEKQDAGVTTRPKMCKQIGKREMALFGERNRGYRIGSLVVE